MHETYMLSCALFSASPRKAVALFLEGTSACASQGSTVQAGLPSLPSLVGSPSPQPSAGAMSCPVNWALAAFRVTYNLVAKLDIQLFPLHLTPISEPSPNTRIPW